MKCVTALPEVINYCKMCTVIRAAVRKVCVNIFARTHARVNVCNKLLSH